MTIIIFFIGLIIGLLLGTVGFGIYLRRQVKARMALAASLMETLTQVERARANPRVPKTASIGCAVCGSYEHLTAEHHDRPGA